VQEPGGQQRVVAAQHFGGEAIIDRDRPPIALILAGRPTNVLAEWKLQDLREHLLWRPDQLRDLLGRAHRLAGGLPARCLSIAQGDWAVTATCSARSADVGT